MAAEESCALGDTVKVAGLRLRIQTNIFEPKPGTNVTEMPAVRNGKLIVLKFNEFTPHLMSQFIDAGAAKLAEPRALD